MKEENNIPKSTGFKVPDHYFKNLGDELQRRLELEKQLNFKKDEGFRVPISYFESVHQDVINRLPSSIEGQKPKSGILLKLLYPTIAVAAAAMLLFILNPFIQDQGELRSIDRMTVQTYLEQNNLDNIEYDIEWLVASENIDLLLEEVTTSDENILDYFQEETDLKDLTID